MPRRGGRNGGTEMTGEHAGSAGGRDHGPGSEQERFRCWRVGSDRVELVASAGSWSVRVVRSGWGGLALEADRLFASEVEACAWCERMARVLERDLEDEREGPTGRLKQNPPLPHDQA